MDDTQERLDALKSLVSDTRQIMRKTYAQWNYCGPLWLATAQAICLGLERISALEFGVAQGRSFKSLVDITDAITKTTGIKFDLYGFDTTTGLPELLDYRDHPEIWSAGQYALQNRDALHRWLPENAKLVEGNVAQTVGEHNHSGSSPVGFVSIDLDFYSSTVDALRIFDHGDGGCYLPSVMMYFDDVDGLVTLNSWCGEERAIIEFNDSHERRKIERKTTSGLKTFACHVLDHPVRNAQKPKAPLIIPCSVYG